MKEIKSTCPACGAVLPGSAPLGLCPKCLADLGQSEPTAVKESLSALDAPRAIDSHPDTATSAHPESHPSNLPDRLFAHAFGDYELFEEIARGGMGVVYRARHRSLNRIVAVKMILSAQFAGQQFGQRFRNEAAAAAILQHPNIVAIHNVGVQDGQQFFSMNYVEGQNLAQLVGNRPLPPARAARYLKLIAEAIHYAHDQGILHRDLKPSNVLIDSATDQPRITDFGLAKRLDGTSSLTVTGQVLGSPSFMPPEQAGSDRGKVGRPSDVYALGGILYFLLTGRAPFQAESLEAIVTQVLHSEPVSPRLLNPAVPRDLETICLKCLEKQPDKRYSTAQQLAEELNRFLRGEPIQARPVSAPERLWRWCGRKPALAGSLFLIIILLLIVIIGSPIALIRINRAREQSDRAREQSEKLLYIANMRVAQNAWEQNNLELVGRMLHETEAASYHGFEWFYWQRQIHLAATTLHCGSNVIAISVSPDGKRFVSGGDSTVLKVRDMATGRELLTLNGLIGSVFAVAFSPNGERIISGGQDKTARIWETATGRVIRKLEGTGEIESVAFSPDGQRVLTGSNDKKVQMWDVATGKVLLTVAGNPCTFSPDGRQILTGVSVGTGPQILSDGKGTNCVAVLYDSIEGHLVRRFAGHTAGIYSVAFSPDGTRFVTGSADLTARVWEAATGRELFTLGPHGQGVDCVAFSRNGERIATAGMDQMVRVWNANDGGPPLFIFKGHTAQIEGLDFCPDGRIVSGGRDSTIRIWDAEGPRETRRFGGDNRQIWGLAFSPDGRRLACTGSMWDLETGRELFPIAGTMLSFSPDGRQILTAQGFLGRLFDAETGQEIQKFKGHTGGTHSVAFSNDGKRIVTAAIDRLAIIWDATSGKELHRLEGHTGPVIQAAFSPDGNRVLTVSEDETARIWNGSTGAELSRFTEHGSWVIACAFSPDGQWIVTGDADRTILVWDAATKRVAHILKGHNSAVQSLVFSRDGRRILSASEDGTARLWDVASGREILVLKGDNGPIFRVAFSRDGRQIATGGRAGIAQVWESATPEQVAAWTAEETKIK